MPDCGPLIFGPPLTEMSNVHDFGARGDGVTDDTAAINAALATCSPVFFPPGTYNTTGSHVIACNGQVIWGTGPGASIINCISSSAPVFTVNVSLSWTGFREIGIWRNGGYWAGGGGAAAVVGGNGIVYNNTGSNALIQNVVLNNHYVGLVLGNTDISVVDNVWIEGCASHGVMFDSTHGGALQWRLCNMVSQANNGHGYYVPANPGGASCVMGEWSDLSTFANSGYGMVVLGTSDAQVYDLRITSGFIGADAAGELYLDTYGDNHKIIGLFTELAGNESNGRGLLKPAPHSGMGINVTANNRNVMLEGVVASAHSEHGFLIAGAETLMVGCRAASSGIAHTGGRNGVNHLGGVLMMSGCRSGNTIGGTDQLYGVATYDGSKLGVVGCDLRGNTTAALFYSTNAGLVTAAGNMTT
jgi:hypothetical protein